MERVELPAAFADELPARDSLLLRAGLLVEPERVTSERISAMAFALTKMAREQQGERLDSLAQTVFFRGPGGAESNARVVEWEDGGVGLFVGEKYFDVELTPNDDSLVFAAREDLLLRRIDPAYCARVNVWQREGEL